MQLITTNYLEDASEVIQENCRTYKTTCEDEHFIHIIEQNRDALHNEFVLTNILYVLMDNENVEDTVNFYASISFRETLRGSNTIYRICIITKEETISPEPFNWFLKKALEDLSYEGDNVRIALTTNPLETTYCVATDEHINVCIEEIIRRIANQ